MRTNVALVLLVISGPTMAALFPGENLLTPYVPPLEEWEALQKKTEHSYIRLYQKKGSSGTENSYSVAVHRENWSLAELKASNDEPGQKHCEKFDSLVVSESSVGPYPAVTWLTACERNGQVVSRILQKAIRGKDSLYHIQRMWRVPVSDEEIALWKERLAGISVCDTRAKDAPCSSSWEPVK